MKLSVEKLKSWIEIAILCSSLLTAFWFKIVEPRFENIVSKEISFTNFLIYEMISDEQLEEGTLKYKRYIRDNMYR
jgi:hypothetical protein